MATKHSTVVAAVFCLALTVTILFLSRQQLADAIAHIRNKRQVEKTPFTFDDYMSGEYMPKYVGYNWIPGTNRYLYTTAQGDLAEMDLDSNASSVLITAANLTEFGTSRYWLSPDQRYVLLAYDVERVWRYSFTATYRIFDRHEPIASRRYIDFPRDSKLQGKRLQYVEWSTTGHGLVFVAENNLYYQSEPRKDAQQHTFTGEENRRVNGIPDWLYEEEILHGRSALYFSPDDYFLMYGSFVTEQVPIYSYPNYGPEEDMFGDMIDLPYPKAGVPDKGRNTRVEVYVAVTNSIGGAVAQLQPPPELRNQDHYVTYASWATPLIAYVRWVNRVQNETYGVLYDVETGQQLTNYVGARIGGWVNLNTPTTWVDDSENYVTLLPRDEDTGTGAWMQVALVTAPLTSAGTVTFLTGGNNEVSSLRGYDNDRKLIYYLATNGDPLNMHLFRVGLPSAAEADRSAICLTCTISNCTSNSASFSPLGKYYVHSCRGPGVPTFMLKNITADTETLLEDNAELVTRLNTKLLPTTRFMTVPVGAGQMANVKLTLPPNFDEQQQYPMLVRTYAGPGGQLVSSAYSIGGWGTYLASSEGVIEAVIDGRGSRGRGESFKHAIYRKLGQVEVQDQLLAGQWMKDNLPYVNNSATAIWGWSYGGFVTLHALGDASNTYDCGIAVAPVVDYKAYDTAYTERFMGLDSPSDNADGYLATDVRRKVANFQGKRLLLVHGTADDNVHWTNTAQMSRALVNAGIQFKLQLYPDRNHGIRGGNTRRQLYRSFGKHVLQRCWGLSING